MKNTIKRGMEAAVSRALAGVFASQKLLLILLAGTLIVLGCNKPTGGHTHTWQLVTSSGALITKTCSGCGETDGAPYTLEIGDTGPGGGIIFYVSTGGFTVTGTGSFTAHYLEASPENLTGGTGSDERIRWLTATGFPYPATTGTLETIGSGKNNTAIIITAESTAYPGNTYIYAARACSEYTGGGKDDWFLPSKDELDELYKANENAGISITGWFWSSSQYDNYSAWHHDFDDSGQSYGTKYYISNVRAVRAF